MRNASNWKYAGRIFEPARFFSGRGIFQSHGQLPIPWRRDESRLRIFFASRDASNRTYPTYLDVAPENPKDIIYFHDQPLIQLGRARAFDDRGVMPSCVVEEDDGRILLYYTGWSAHPVFPFHTSIGVAVSEDRGDSFERMFDEPILDCTPTEPFASMSPFVLKHNGSWQMWYGSVVEWITYDGRQEARYNIKYAHSADGVNWTRDGVVAIELSGEDEGGISRPCVLPWDGGYRMWYSVRGSRDFRSSGKQTYRLGCADSADGLTWARRDELMEGFSSVEEWDSGMRAYPYIHKSDETYRLYYCGNGFGQSGFGYAQLE